MNSRFNNDDTHGQALGSVMNRRMAGGALLAGAAGMGAAHAQSSSTARHVQTYGPAKVSLRLVTAWSSQLTGMTQVLERFTQRVLQLTQGGLNIVFEHQDQSGFKAQDLLTDVASGKLDMAHSTAYYWTRRSPAFNFFATVPFGMLPQEHYAWLRHGGGLELWQKLAASHGVHVLPCGNTGVQMGGWFRKKIRSTADLQGAKIRYPGLGGEIFRRMGAVPTMLPASEIKSALQTGRLDAAEWVSPWGDFDLGMHQVADHYYFPGIHEPGHTLELLINPAVWAKLSSHHQQVIETAAWLEFSDMLADFNHQNSKAIQNLSRMPKLQILRFPNDVIAEFRRLTPLVIKETLGSDAQAQAIWHSYSQYMRQQMRWAEMSDRAYWQARY
jgi:TRAP-type mannitol/chloroaromatic compound transport system substrate-binding protein